MDWEIKDLAGNIIGTVEEASIGSGPMGCLLLLFILLPLILFLFALFYPLYLVIELIRWIRK